MKSNTKTKQKKAKSLTKAQLKKLIGGKESGCGDLMNGRSFAPSLKPKKIKI